MTIKILLTGFDPFGNEKMNPSFEAVRKVKNFVNGAEILKAQLPTVFKKSFQILKDQIDLHNPDIVICVGQAGGRYEINVERVAINTDDARIPDNEGQQPIDIQIEEDGENAYFSNLPIKAMVQEIKFAGIPAAVSNTAGTFVCNHILYKLLHLISVENKKIRGGFIHVPYLPEQVLDKKDIPSMSLDDIVKALEASINALTKN